MQTSMLRHNASGIHWYCELRGSGPSVVLIPSGEGDCGSFAKVADELAKDFNVLTFDMPGFSRSSPPPDFGRVTADELADQVASLVTSLNLAPGAFYGCSSAGLAALSLVARHADVVRNAIVHEAALINDVPLPEVVEALSGMNNLDDVAIVGACKDLFRTKFISDGRAWDALGDEYHRRLEKNYVTWVRHYVWAGLANRTYSSEELTRRPIAWSIGGFSEVWFGVSNLRVAQRANLTVDILPCKHFPQVEVPGLLADRIRKCVEQDLQRAHV
jgi:pimeloyl-ACP methyl ester carboxylesterase